MTLPSYTNRLVHETSPYLLQHAHNPVDWFPWCAEALEQARKEDKPILLSIGYSACHWCHVMAHESFEDTETAAVMNRLFVNIKIDREERPDLDKIYQLSHHIITQRSGGWPLTMFLTPGDHIPFYGGTYYPKEPRHGLPSFVHVMNQVAGFYREHRQDIDEQNGRLLAILTQLERTPAESDQVLNAAPLDLARSQLAQSFDVQHGGFSVAPKFPHPTHIERLLRHWAATASSGRADQQALDMALLTLTKMADGGIYDQLGGGFFRYAVDESWMIPHFEKMLYDNAQLLVLFTQASRINDSGLYKRVSEETAHWVMREMQSPEGGYYSALDADSEGVEGKFYTWTPAQIKSVLGAREYAIFARRYGLDQPANFEESWHLHVFHGLKNLSQEFSLAPAEILSVIDPARRKLFEAREARPHPGRDEKILTSWNGLMINAMACAGHYLHQSKYLDSAQRALDFIRAHLWRDGRLLAVYKDGVARHPAYLDDYVFLIDGLLELLQARWCTEDMEFARDLAEVVIEHFEDGEHGGFFFTANDHEKLFHRPKALADEAMPSGNGVAARVLGRLGHLLGEARYLDAGERCLKSAWPAMSALPYAHDSLLAALEEWIKPPQLIVMRGRPEAMRAWQEGLDEILSPRRLVVAIPADAGDLPGVLAHCVVTGEMVAYVCTGAHCSAPVTTLQELLSAAHEFM